MSDASFEVVVYGRHVEVSETLRRSATQKAERLSRYLVGIQRAEVCFSDTPIGRLDNPVTCEIVLEGPGRVVRSLGAGGRPNVALDAAVEKAELQLARLKGRLVGRSRPRHGTSARDRQSAQLSAVEGAAEGSTPDEPEDLPVASPEAAEEVPG